MKDLINDAVKNHEIINITPGFNQAFKELL